MRESVTGHFKLLCYIILHYIDSCLKVIYFGMRLEIFLFDYVSNAVSFPGKWSSLFYLGPL